MDSEADKEEEGGRAISLESVVEWERLQCPQPSPDCSFMVLIRDYPHEDRRTIIFPPVNHENLHLNPTAAANSDVEYRGIDESSHSSAFSPSPLHYGYGHREHLSNRWRSQAIDVARWLRLGLELLRAKVNDIVSSFRMFCKNGRPVRFLHSSAGAAAVAAAAMVVAFSYISFRRKRPPQVRKESIDDLIRLLKDRDEKIDELLNQIRRMNEVLLALHRVPMSKTS